MTKRLKSTTANDKKSPFGPRDKFEFSDELLNELLDVSA